MFLFNSGTQIAKASRVGNTSMGSLTVSNTHPLGLGAVSAYAAGEGQAL